jgi:hypothetical protein
MAAVSIRFFSRVTRRVRVVWARRGFRHGWGRHAALALGCLLCTFVLLNREILPLNGVRAEGLALDYGLLTWDLWATTESALRGESVYQTRLLYYPLGSNLAAHTLGPGFIPVGLVARIVRGDQVDYPLYAHRLSILLCFSLGMFLAHRALRALGASAPAALAGSIGWAFAAFWHPIVANQTLASACFLIPAVTLALGGLVRRPSAARAAGLAALVAAGPYFSEHFAAFVPLALIVAALGALVARGGASAVRRVLASLRLKGVASAGAVGVVVALPFLLAWTGAEGGPPREKQVRAGGARLVAFVLPEPSVTPLYRGVASRLHEPITRGRGPFLGVPTILLATVGIVRGRRLRGVMLTLAAVFLVLSLGPELRVLGAGTGLPLPYTLLQRLPPFEMARAPWRLAAFGIWALICLAALGLTAASDLLTHRLGPAAGRAAVTLALVWWTAEGYHPGFKAAEFTAASKLSELPPGAVVNLPLNVRDGLAMFLQVFHGRPIVTGYVSRASQRQFDHVARLQRLLEHDPHRFAQAMRALGVGTVVLEPGTPRVLAGSLVDSGLHIVDLRRGMVRYQKPSDRLGEGGG